MASTFFCPSGEAISSSFKFDANTEIASASARFLSSSRMCVSEAGASSLLYESSTASFTCSAHSPEPFAYIFLRISTAGASSGTTRIIKNPSASPRRTARILCDGAFFAGSFQSK